jgi:hypothetical protein
MPLNERFSLDGPTARIGSSYANAAAEIVSILGGIDPSVYTPISGASALGKVRSIVERLDVMAVQWARGSIKAAYEDSRKNATARLKVIGAEKPKPRQGSAPPPDRHGKAVDRSFKLAVGDYLDANQAISATAGKYLATVGYAKRKIDKFRNEAMVEAFSPDEVKGFIDRTVKKSLASTSEYNAGLAHLTSQDVAARIKEKLLKSIKGGDFINIVGKDGVARNYNLKNYSELVARTRMREAQTEAVKEACAEYDNDLVFIPPHDNPCEEICAAYQGQVYSISGTSDTYPELPDGGPPWHPHCEDSMNPTSETALSWRNQ